LHSLAASFHNAAARTFVGAALALAIIGTYGVLSYSVAQRRQEFRIRLALGAEEEDIFCLVLRQGLMPPIVGTAIGIFTVLTRLMFGMLYKVGTHDLATFILMPVVFLCIAMLAMLSPCVAGNEGSPSKPRGEV